MRLLAPLLILAALAAPAQAAKKKSCTRAGDTVMRSSQTRIYDVGQKVYACHLKSRKRTFLTRYVPGPEELDDYRSFIRPRLAGRFVAFGNEFGCDRLGDCGGTVRVVDTRTGDDVHSGGVTIPSGAPSSDRALELPALYLKADGSAAYIMGPTFDKPYEVVRLAGGTSTRLDEGNVDPRSLAINESRIYWMRDGSPFTAAWR